MSKWTHAFSGPGEDGNVIVVVSSPSEVSPETLAAASPREWVDSDGTKHLIEYVGSGKGDWWERTANIDDPLVTPWLRTLRELTGNPIPQVRPLP